MFLNFAEDDERIFFMLFQEPIMVEMQKKTGKITKSRVISNERGRAGLFSQIYLIQEKIMCIPWNSNFFSVYDLKKDELRVIDIPEKELKKQSYGLFRTAIQNKQTLYAFGVNYHGVVRINLEEEKAECIANLADLGRGFIDENVVLNQKVYIPLAESSKIAIFDLETEELTYVELKVKNKSSIRTICYDGNSFWISFSDNSVIKTDVSFIQTAEINHLSDTLKNFKKVKNSAYFDNSIFFFPEESENVIKYNRIDQTIELIDIENINSIIDLYYANIVNNYLLLYSEMRDQVYSYCQNSKKFMIFKEQPSGNEYLKVLLENNFLTKEKDSNSLINFINTVSE